MVTQGVECVKLRKGVSAAHILSMVTYFIQAPLLALEQESWYTVVYIMSVTALFRSGNTRSEGEGGTWQ